MTDLNYGDHLGNDSLLSIIHQARIQLLKSVQCTELDIGGVSLIMGDVAIVFKSEGFLDDQLEINMTLLEFGPKSFEIFYRIENITTKKTLALAKTGMVCFDYNERKVGNVPTSFKANFD